MHVELSLHDNGSLLTVTGDVDTVDVPVLRRRMFDALEENSGDILLDMRQVGSVSDDLMPALTATRTQAKHVHHRVVVIDDVTGTTTRSLRRLGLQFRIAAYRDPASAVAGLSAEREARARLDVGRGSAPAPAPIPLFSSSDADREAGPDDEAPHRLVQAGRALSSAAPPGPDGRP